MQASVEMLATSYCSPIGVLKEATLVKSSLCMVHISRHM